MKLNSKIILCLFAVFVSLSVFSQDTEGKFSKGVDAYTAGDFNEALQSWLELYDSGYRSPNLSYNIGNAYFKLGEIPDAILFYERAHLLKPADENINYNLGIAKTLTVDRFNEIPELFFVRWFNFISLMFKGNTWSIISVTSFIICLIFLSLYIYSSRYKLKVTGFWIAIMLFTISVSSISFSLQNNSLVNDSRKAIIMVPQISGKSSPDNSGTDLFILHEGTKVSIGDEVGGWYEIRLSDGNKGWVPVTSVNII